MAVTSTFSSGTLFVFGDSLDNAITVSRNAAGTILVNGGAVAVVGGTPTVANTSLIRCSGKEVMTVSPSTKPTVRFPPPFCSAEQGTTS